MAWWTPSHTWLCSDPGFRGKQNLRTRWSCMESWKKQKLGYNEIIIARDKEKRKGKEKSGGCRALSLEQWRTHAGWMRSGAVDKPNCEEPGMLCLSRCLDGSGIYPALFLRWVTFNVCVENRLEGSTRLGPKKKRQEDARQPVWKCCCEEPFSHSPSHCKPSAKNLELCLKKQIHSSWKSIHF